MSLEVVFNPQKLSVSTGGTQINLGVDVQPLTVTENGEYSETGKAFSPVTVAVPGIIPTGTKTITGNGAYDVTQFASANVQRPFIGDNPVLLRSVLKDKVYLKDTGFATWTPSTTASVIVPYNDEFTFDADMLNKDYVLRMQYYVHLNYNDGAEQKGLFLEGSSEYWYCCYRYPSGVSQLFDRNLNANGANLALSVSLAHYYAANGTESLVNSLAYGITCSANTPTASNNSASNPTYTVRGPNIQARCHDSYFKPANALFVNQNTSFYQLRYDLWSVDYGTSLWRIAQDSKNEIILNHGLM